MAEDTDEDSNVVADDGTDGVDVELSQSDASGIAWLVVGVLVAAVVSLLLVGALVDEPIADQATELGIGFAWLLAASYVGFRIEGDAQLRLVGAGAFLFAAVAHFLSLLVDVPALAVLRLVAVLVGAIVLIVLVRR
jgi:hypothetical protein